MIIFILTYGSPRLHTRCPGHWRTLRQPSIPGSRWARTHQFRRHSREKQHPLQLSCVSFPLRSAPPRRKRAPWRSARKGTVASLPFLQEGEREDEARLKSRKSQQKRSKMTVHFGLGSSLCPSPRRGQGERGQATETSPLSVRAVRTFGECQQPELPAQPERGTCQSQDRAANHDRSRPLGTFLCGPTLCGGCRSRHMWSKLSRWLTISPCLLELRGRLSGGIRAHLHTAARHGLHICPLVGCLLRGGNLFHPEKGFWKHAGNVSQMSPENHCKQVCAFVLEKHLFKVNVY